MHAASAYLLRLVTLSEEGDDDTCQPPSMTWVLRGKKSDRPEPPQTTQVRQEDLEWMNRRPALVVAGPKPKPAQRQNKGKGKGMKRPAAAAAAAAAIPPTVPEDEVSFPSEAGEQQEFFGAVPPIEPTDASTIHGAPNGAVVPPLPPMVTRKGRRPDGCHCQKVPVKRLLPGSTANADPKGAQNAERKLD